MAADPVNVALAMNNGNSPVNELSPAPETYDSSHDSFVQVEPTTGEDDAGDKASILSIDDNDNGDNNGDEEKNGCSSSAEETTNVTKTNREAKDRVVIVIHGSDSESDGEDASPAPVAVSSGSSMNTANAANTGNAANTINTANTVILTPPANVPNGLNPSPLATAFAAHVHVLTGAPIVPLAGALFPPFVVTSGPWVVGNAYGVVPNSPMAPNPAITSANWYTVWKGRWVGVMALAPLCQAATSGVSHAGSKGFNSQVEALDLFNQCLMLGLVEVV